MSLTQVSSAPKIENAVYLGLSAMIIVFFVRLLAPDFLLRPDALFYITLGSTLLAAFLYYIKVDKVVDLLYVLLLRSYQYDIQQFMAMMDSYLRVWETSPTELIPYEKKASHSTITAIQGHDMYSSMWSQKGLLFFMVSILFAAALLYPEFATGAILFGFIPESETVLLVIIVVEIVLLLTGRHRHRETPARCANVVKFRHYQDCLNMDRTMRKREAPITSSAYLRRAGGGDEGPTQEQVLREYKEALLSQCVEIDQILARKEWGRFMIIIAQLEGMLTKEVDSLLRNEALGLVLSLWKDVIESEDSQLLAMQVRLQVLLSAIKPLANQEDYLQTVHAVPTLSRTQLQEYLDVIPILNLLNPSEFPRQLWSLIALIIAKGIQEGRCRDLIDAIQKWTRLGLDSVGNTMGILSQVSPVQRSIMLEELGKASAPISVEILRPLLNTPDYVAIASVLELLSYMPDELTDDDISIIVDYAHSHDYRVSTPALEALSGLGKEILNDNEVVRAFSSALRSGDDKRVAATLESLMEMRFTDDIPDWLRNELSRVFSQKGPFLQTRCFAILERTGVVHNYSDILWLEIEKMAKPPQGKAKRSPKMIVQDFLKKAPERDDFKVLFTLLNLRTDMKMLEQMETDLLAWLNRLDNHRHRLTKTAVLLLLGIRSSRDQNSGLHVYRILNRFEANPPGSIETAMGILLGSFDARELPYVVNLFRRADWMQKIGFRALFHMGKVIATHPGIMMTVANSLSSSDLKEYVFLVLTLLGEEVQGSINSVHRVIQELSTNDEITVVGASQALGSIRDKRALEPLKKANDSQQMGWVRHAIQKAIVLIESSQAKP